MLNKEKELLLRLLMEKHQEEDDDDCCVSVISSPLPPEEWEYSSMQDAMLIALGHLHGVREVSVEYSTWHKMRISVVGGHPQDIAETIQNYRYSGVVMAHGNYCVEVVNSWGATSNISFNYGRG